MISIGVIGGGASGMAAAIAAARNGAKVTIIEQKERLGKKILSTGNGRCNLTNEHMEPACFRGESKACVPEVLKQFGYKDTLSFFEELGVLTKSKNGYFYPRSEQATTIVDALEMELRRLGVECFLQTCVKEIKKNKKGFHVYAVEKISIGGSNEKHNTKKAKKKKATEFIEKDVKFSFDKIILAAGGKAASVLGSDGSGYALAKAFGHSLSPVVPALVQLRSEDSSFKKLAGIRTEGTVHLYVDGKMEASDTGEIQLTDYGISGIPVFQVSRYAALGIYEHRNVTAVIDFVPFYSESEFADRLINHLGKWHNNTIEEYLQGVFNKKLIPVFLDKLNVECFEKVKDIPQKWFCEFAHFCKNYKIEIIGTNSFEQAQVCAGGVRVSEINHNTMESEYASGLYLTGELLDIDGICGGYNLQWAWSTGIIAGRSASC